MEGGAGGGRGHGREECRAQNTSHAMFRSKLEKLVQSAPMFDPRIASVRHLQNRYQLKLEKACVMNIDCTCIAIHQGHTSNVVVLHSSRLS